jgi:hypothetical protein
LIVQPTNLLELLWHYLQNGIRLQAPCLRQKDAGPFGIGGLSENWKHTSADFHVTSGSSGTVAITDPAVDDVGNVSHN